MAKPPRRLLYQAWCSFVDSFKPRTSNAVLMGEDKLGNKYFESKPTSSSNRTKAQRWYLPASGEEDFMQELPSEWESWLRGRRKVPPTPEELAKNYAILLMKKENAKKLEAERKGAKLLDPPSKPKGMESYPQYGEQYEDLPGRSLDPNKKQQ